MMEWIVTSTAMILIVIALRGLLKGKISLKLQYGLWALVLVRLLLPFSIVDSAISITNILSAPVIQNADEAVADYRESYEAVRQDYTQQGQEVTEDDIRLQVQQHLYDRAYSQIEKEYAQSGAAVTADRIHTEAQQQVQVISLTAVITEALPYFWVAGMIAVAFVLTGSNLHFWWKLRQNRKTLDIPGVQLKVYLTDYVATPCLFGTIKPDIYLTNEVMMDSRMRRHVLAHEMSHYRQGDHIWSVLRSLCLVLHWYNPMVWVAAVLSKQDAELACDEATIKTLGETERTAYGRTLIGMTCVRRDPRSLMLTATTMLGTKKTLKERIALIAKKPKTALYTLIACVLVAAIAVGCTFTGMPTEPPATDPTTEPTTESTTEPTEPTTTEPTTEPTEPTEPPATEPTEPPAELDEVGKFQNLLTSQNGYWYWRALGCIFENPESIDMTLLCYCGMENRILYSSFTDDEIAFLKSKFPANGFDDSPWSNAHKLPRQELEAVMQTYFGVSLDDVSIPWVYYEKTDAYYHVKYDSYGLVEYTVTDVDYHDDGTVSVYWHVPFGLLDRRDPENVTSLNDADMLLTLKDNGDGTYTVLSNLPLQSTIDREYFGQLLKGDEWYGRIIGCVFEEPEDVSLYYLFYNGLPYDERQNSSDFTDSEVAFLKDVAVNSSWRDESVWVNAHKMPSQYISDVLNDYFGLTLDDVTIPEEWSYFEETDSYYYIRSDGYGVNGFTVTGVQTDDNGLIYVYWTTNYIRDTRTEEIKFINEPQMVMVLEEREDGGYRIHMNMPVEELMSPTEPSEDPVEPDIIDILFSAEKLEAKVSVGGDGDFGFGVNADLEQPLRDLLSRYEWTSAEDDTFTQSNAVINISGFMDETETMFYNYWFRLRAIEDGKFWISWEKGMSPREYYILTPKDPETNNSYKDILDFVREHFSGYPLPGRR